MGPIWATHIWANPYGTHAEPSFTPHMGSPYGTHIGMFAGYLLSLFLNDLKLVDCIRSDNILFLSFVTGSLIHSWFVDRLFQSSITLCEKKCFLKSSLN